MVEYVLRERTLHGCLSSDITLAAFFSKTSSINFLISRSQEAGRASGLETHAGLCTSLAKVVFPTVSPYITAFPALLHLSA